MHSAITLKAVLRTTRAAPSPVQLRVEGGQVIDVAVSAAELFEKEWCQWQFH